MKTTKETTIDGIEETVRELTNDKGREFLDQYIHGPLTAYYLGTANWFYVVSDEGFFYALPYRDIDCSPSFFGDVQHIFKTLGWDVFEVYTARLNYHNYNEYKGSVLCKNVNEVKETIKRQYGKGGLNLNPFYALIRLNGETVYNEHLRLQVK